MVVDLHVRVVMSCPVADTRGIAGVFMCQARVFGAAPLTGPGPP